MSYAASLLVALLDGQDLDLSNGQCLRYVTGPHEGIGLVYQAADGEERVALDPVICAALQRLSEAQVKRPMAVA